MMKAGAGAGPRRPQEINRERGLARFYLNRRRFGSERLTWRERNRRSLWHAGCIGHVRGRDLTGTERGYWIGSCRRIRSSLDGLTRSGQIDRPTGRPVERATDATVAGRPEAGEQCDQIVAHLILGSCRVILTEP